MGGGSQEVSNQTRKRRGGGVGRPAGKKGYISPLAPGGEPAIPPYEAPNGQGQLGVPPPPWRGPHYGSGDYPTTRRRGGGYRTNPRKSASHWSNGFLPTSWVHHYIFHLLEFSGVCEVWQYRKEKNTPVYLHTGPKWPLLAPVLLWFWFWSRK